MANFSFPLFKNDYKNRDTHPDYRAQITIEDEHLEVLREIIAKVDAGDSVAVDCAAWMRQSKSGKNYYSCMFSVTPEKYRKDTQSNGHGNSSNSESNSNAGPSEETPF